MLHCIALDVLICMSFKPVIVTTVSFYYGTDSTGSFSEHGSAEHVLFLFVFCFIFENMCHLCFGLSFVNKVLWGSLHHVISLTHFLHSMKHDR